MLLFFKFELFLNSLYCTKITIYCTFNQSKNYFLVLHYITMYIIRFEWFLDSDFFSAYFKRYSSV